jgi:hypothetical protein
MKIVFENNQEKENVFFHAMCNGLSNTRYWEFEVDYNEKHYNSARKSLEKKGMSICYEDVFMQMLRMGKTIEFIDIGCDGEYSKSLTLEMVYNNIDKTPNRNLVNIINEHDDSIDADAILQSVLFEDIIFG